MYPIQITLEDLWDAQERSNYLFVAANSKKKPAEPNSYKRAWDKPQEKRLKTLKMTADQAKKFYTGLAKKRDASVSPDEIRRRNQEYNDKLKREEMKKNGNNGTQE